SSPTARWTASTSSPRASTRSSRSSSTPAPAARASSAARRAWAGCTRWRRSPSRLRCASRWWRWSATGPSTIPAPSGWSTTTRSPTVIREAYARFTKIFGRDYGNPFFEEYMTDDAEVVIVGMGTLSNPVRVAIREMRKEGKKVGFVRVRWFRPFAAEELAKTLSRFKAVGIIDRDFSLGAPYSSGVLATEVRAALYPVANRPPLLAFICGLGGREVTLPDVKKMTDNI